MTQLVDAARLDRIRIVASDVDGTLTDGSMVYSSSGLSTKSFSVKDGLAVRLLRAISIEVAFVSSDDSPIVRSRARRLGVERCLTGVSDKVAAVSDLCSELSAGLENVAFIGDDLQDLAVMRAAGLAVAVGDAHPMIIESAGFVCERPGGSGAFREFSEWLIARKGYSLGDVWERCQHK